MLDFDLTSSDFRTAYFEQKPHLFRGALAERPVAWPDVDQLLHVMEPSAPSMRLFHQGPVPEHAYTQDVVGLGKARRRLNKAKFYGYMGSGATLVINRLEDYCVAAKRLCVEIGRFAGAQTSGNAYLSFNGRGTFGKHWDTHDVFAIQLIGCKRWQVFSPTLPLPLTYQTNERSGHVCPDEPVLECTLEEGDVLYVPRGWWHQAIPLDVGSFHFSVGTYSATVFDYVMWTLGRYLQQDPAVRRAFSSADSPANYRAALAEAVHQMSAVLLDPARAAEFERDMAGREPLNAEFNLGLSLASGAASLSEEAVVGLTSCYAPNLERGEILVNGALLPLDPACRAVIAALRDCTTLRFDALCGRLHDIPQAVMQRAVLDLALHDIVTIQTGSRLNGPFRPE